MPQARSASGSFTTRWSVQYNCITILDMHSKTLQELVKTREDLELAEQERDTVQQILTHSSMMYANSDEELESLREFVVQAMKMCKHW